MFTTEWIAGLDLGQARDYTALALVQRVEAPGSRPEYHLRHLARPPLGTPYPQVTRQTRDLLARPELREARLVVDATGVGRPVLDLLREHGLDPVGVTITSGESEVRVSEDDYRVPKRDLVSTLLVLLQTGRLKIASSLPLAGALTRELLAFRASINPNGNETYAAERERDHDDLVLALALACWWSERHGELQVWL